MRKQLTLVAAAAAVLMSMPLAAQAFPVAISPTTGSEAPVTLVAGGCGPGFHRGPMLGCRPNRVIVARPAFVVRRPAVIVRRPAVIVRRPFCRTVLLPLPHRVCR